MYSAAKIPTSARSHNEPVLQSFSSATGGPAVRTAFAQAPDCAVKQRFESLQNWQGEFLALSPWCFCRPGSGRRTHRNLKRSLLRTTRPGGSRIQLLRFPKETIAIALNCNGSKSHFLYLYSSSLRRYSYSTKKRGVTSWNAVSTQEN